MERSGMVLLLSIFCALPPSRDFFFPLLRAVRSGEHAGFVRQVKRAFQPFHGVKVTALPCRFGLSPVILNICTG